MDDEPDLPDLLRAIGFTKPAWQADAACREHPDLSWYPSKGETSRRQQQICMDCLVRVECRDAGIDGNEAGIWGGISDPGRNRRKIERLTAA